MGVFTLIFSILIDCLLIYSAYNLMNTSPNNSNNVLEKKKRIITFVWGFCDIQKWILFIPKMDLALGSIFCVNSSSSSILAMRCSNNVNFSIMPHSIFILIGIISILLTFTTSLVASFIYINIDFQKKNPLKPIGNFEDTASFLFIFLIVLFSYIPLGNTLLGSFIISSIFGLYLLKQYILNYPVLGKSIICSYGNFILAYLVGICLIILR